MARKEATEEAGVPRGLGKCSVTSKKTDRTVEFSLDFGGSLDDAVEKFGEEPVYDAFVSASKVKAQARARAVLDDESHTEDEAAEAGRSYVPGVTIRRVSSKRTPLQQLRDEVKAGKRTPDELEAAIKELLAELDEEG